MLFSAIDLHKRSVAIHTLDAEGTVVRAANLPAQRRALTAYFGTMPGPHRCAASNASCVIACCPPPMPHGWCGSRGVDSRAMRTRRLPRIRDRVSNEHPTGAQKQPLALLTTNSLGVLGSDEIIR